MITTIRKTTTIKPLMMLGLVFLLICSLALLRKPARSFSNTAQLPQKYFHEDELKKYDGTDSNSPTYLAYEGLVYDVTPGRDAFYGPGKPYHNLAGKDATNELKIAGGSIIRQKYPVVGKLSD